MAVQNAANSILNIIAWNANGLSKNKAIEFQVTMNKLQTDIVLFSETHFTREERWLFPGFKMYNARHPSNKGRGGSSIVIREKIKHSLVKIIEDENFQTVVIEIETSSLGRFNLASVYSPPKHSLSEPDYENLIGNLGNRFLIGGDWNCKNVRWASRYTNKKGANLEKVVNNIGGNFITPGKFTYFPPLGAIGKKPDVLDFFVFNNINLINRTACDTLKVKFDHAPLTLSVFSTPVLKARPPTLISHRTDWKKFNQILTNSIDNDVRIDTVEKLEEETSLLVNLIQEAAKASTPVAINSNKHFYLPPDILQLIKSKGKARKRMQETKCEGDKKHYNFLNNAVKSRLSKYRNDKFETFISKLGAREIDDYSLWKATKYLKRPAQLSFPISTGNDEWATNSQEKADILANHLENTFKPNPCEDLDKLRLLETENKNLTYLPKVKIEKISEHEVFDEIKYKTKIKKAPGFDLIAGIIVKQLPRAALKKMTKIFNAVLDLRVIPSQWKKAEIIVLLKPGKPPAEPNSYRPISLLPIICKLFEKLYIKRLRKIVKSKNLLIDEQFGFREQHSTVEQLHRISTFVDNSIEKGEFCNIAFLDVAQAFDRVWHQRLIYKLSKILPANHVEILSSYIANRLFRVRFEDAYSEFKPICAGVPQGSVLSPLIYSLYTYDIPRPRRGCKLGVFADDTAYAASAPKYEDTVVMLQGGLDDIQEWAAADRTKTNAAKSENVVFTLRNYVYIPVFLNNCPIPHANKARYLGLIMDSKLKWKDHILKKREQIKMKHRQMLWLLGRRSKLKLENKILLYKSMIRPIWSYGCQLWACAAKSNIQLITTLQNVILRQMLNAPWYMRNSDILAELGIEDTDTYISRMYCNYEDRLLVHPNTEAISLLDWDEEVRRLKRRKPHELSTPLFRKI